MSIVLSWLTSPLCGGIISFLLFRLIQRQIITRKYLVTTRVKFKTYAM